MADDNGLTDLEAGEASLAARLVPLGDRALLLRFGDRLSAEANRRAIGAAHLLVRAKLAGVQEIAPNLVSVLLRYNPAVTSFFGLSMAVRLALASAESPQNENPRRVEISVAYGGDSGPDLEEAAACCGLCVEKFVALHNGSRLRVLATGFAPGFVYCGMHEKTLCVPRRKKIHAMVPPGSIIFAAGQTAITATPVPTGWHVIGRTKFQNFDPARTPPTRLEAGDEIRFVSMEAK